MPAKKFEKILVFDFNGMNFLSGQLKQYCKKLELISADKDFSDKMKPESLKGADAFVAKPFGEYNRGFLAMADRLKYFGLVSTSFACVDTNYLKERGIAFTNVPHYSTDSVAEMTFSALLEIARKTSEAINIAKTNYSAKRHIGTELHGKTLGIIGLGKIGTRVSKIAKGFGMDVIYFSRTRKTEEESRIGISYMLLDELLKKSDIVSIHCTYSEETRNLLSKEKVSLLKDGAILLNSCRTEICDLDAVKELAEKGKISCWFDALDEEEQRKKLIGLENVIATPHIGWMTKEAQSRVDEIAVENVKNFLEGKNQNRIV